MRSPDDEDLLYYSNSNLLCRKCSSLSISSTCSVDNNECTLAIATYRPVKCPISNCPGVLSPSTMMTHLEYMHRDIATVLLDMSSVQGCMSINISLQYYKLQPMKPAVVKIILVEGTSSEPVPLLLNMTLLPKIECRPEILPNNDYRSEWLVIWLSSLHLFPYLFTMTLQSYGLPRFSFSQQCSPISLHEYRKKFNPLSPLEDARAMLMNVRSIEKLLQNESGLYVEVQIDNGTLKQNYNQLNQTLFT